MNRFIAGLLLLSAALALSACGPSCTDACTNAAKVCQADFKTAGLTFDVDTCESLCEKNSDGCTNIDAQIKCVAEAKACDDINRCPQCVAGK